MNAPTIKAKNFKRLSAFLDRWHEEEVGYMEDKYAPIEACCAGLSRLFLGQETSWEGCSWAYMRDLPQAEGNMAAGMILRGILALHGLGSTLNNVQGESPLVMVEHVMGLQVAWACTDKVDRFRWAWPAIQNEATHVALIGFAASDIYLLVTPKDKFKKEEGAKAVFSLDHLGQPDLPYGGDLLQGMKVLRNELLMLVQGEEREQRTGGVAATPT